MLNKIETHVLKLSCKDQVGIVSKISTLLAKFKCNIVESKQFTDQQNGNFFIRQSFTLYDSNTLSKLEKNLNLLSNELNAELLLAEIENSMNTVIMVSKFDHCLNDLLFRIRSSSLNLNVKAIISNHKIAEDIARFSKIPFYFLPINKTNKENQEAKIKEINFDKRKTIILSPVKGKVFNLIPQSIGYASTLGENLMNIVPDGDVEAKVFLSNNDVGFVKNKMEADIRIDAYPFTQFGSIKGNLKFVGDEVLPSDYQNPEPRFPAYINLSKQYLIKNGNTYKIRSGQSVSVNLKVRDKPVISLLTDAIDRAFDSLKGIKN